MLLADYQKAIKDYDSAIKQAPSVQSGNYRAYHLRGKAYVKIGNHNQAIKDFDKAIELPKWYYSLPDLRLINVPKTDVVYRDCGLAYYNLRKYFEGFRDLDKAIELNPEAETYLIRAACHEELGHYPQAISDYKDAARLGAIGAQDYLRSKGIQW